MSKIISYALFGSGQTTPENFFELAAYMRGLVWNVRMNKLIYPGWQTHIEIDSQTFSDYDNIFHGLVVHYGVSFSVNEYAPLCKAMLWRLKPIFHSGVEYVICRDADALTTYREAQAVKQFIDSGLDYHTILDNPAHFGMMGGMAGFKAAVVREKYQVWDAIVSHGDTWERGKDQVVLNKLFNTDECRHKTLAHNGHIDNIDLPGVDPRLWESNLCVRHIGSAGVVELETLRFFKRFDTEIEAFEDILKPYYKCFYWYAK